MYYKKFFSVATLVTLVGLSGSAFSSDPIGPMDDEEANYYVRLQYNGEVLPFKTKIDGITHKSGKNTSSPLRASFLSGSGAFGYKMDDIRVDIEGLYSQLSKDADVVDAPAIVENLTAFSGLINVYYDIVIEDMPITPYVGVGIGTAYVSNPLVAKVADDKSARFSFAYQAKAGISYDIAPEIKLFGGARYFGSYGANFAKSSKDDAGIKVLLSTFGTEAGIVFNF